MELESGQTVTDILSIACGGYHSLMVTGVNSMVLSCGLNNYGQLGNGQSSNSPQKLLKMVETISGLGVTQVQQRRRRRRRKGGQGG